VQGMPPNKSKRKPARPAFRPSHKTTDLPDKGMLMRQSALVHSALRLHAQEGSGVVSLALSPRTLVHDLQRQFETEFPHLADRVSFALLPRPGGAVFKPPPQSRTTSMDTAPVAAHPASPREMTPLRITKPVDRPPQVVRPNSFAKTHP